MLEPHWVHSTFHHRDFQKMASLAACSIPTGKVVPRGADTDVTKEDDGSHADTDAALLRSMDREVKKYERLRRQNATLSNAPVGSVSESN